MLSKVKQAELLRVQQSMKVWCWRCQSVLISSFWKYACKAVALCTEVSTNIRRTAFRNYTYRNSWDERP